MSYSDEGLILMEDLYNFKHYGAKETY